MRVGEESSKAMAKGAQGGKRGGEVQVAGQGWAAQPGVQEARLQLAGRPGAAHSGLQNDRARAGHKGRAQGRRQRWECNKSGHRAPAASWWWYKGSEQTEEIGRRLGAGGHPSSPPALIAG